MRYGLNRNYPVYLSTKNTILKRYDGRFKDLFQKIFDEEFAAEFKAKGLVYEAGDFLQVKDYTHVQRWTDQIAKRPAVKRGRMVCGPAFMV